MKSEFIHYTEVLKWIEARDSKDLPVPFSMKYTKADFRRRTGGTEVSVPSAVLYTQPGANKTAIGTASHSDTKKPNHFEHGTINIMLLPSRLIRKVHTRLITEFNNQPVYY